MWTDIPPPLEEGMLRRSYKSFDRPAGLLFPRFTNQKNIAMILLPAINCTPVKARTK